MKRLLSLLLPLMLCGVANGANVKISDLPIITSPSTNTLIEVADMNEATKSRSYLLTNLATVADMLVASNAVKAASQATNSTLTQWASIPTNSFVLKAGDTMTGDLTTTGLILTNDAISDIPLQVNALTGTTNRLMQWKIGTNVMGYVEPAGALNLVGGTTTTTLTPSFGNLSCGGALIAGLQIQGSEVRIGTLADCILYRDGAANTLAQRNGTNAQAYRVYNTWANSGTDYERGFMQWSGNELQIGTEKGGTGSSRIVGFFRNGSRYFFLGSTSLQLESSMLFATDNTYDIGASGATRPRNIYAGSAIYSGTSIQAGSFVAWGAPSAGGYINAPSVGIATFNAQSGTFDRIQLGGTTTNFPALVNVTNAPGMPYIKFTDATGASLRKIVNAGSNGGRTNVLTDATATSVVWISVPNTNRVSGKLFYEIFATDGTESQGISGECKFIAVAKGTTVTAQIADVQTTAAVSAGTLTGVIAANTSTNNVIAFTINSDTSLTSTNHTAVWRIESPGLFDTNPL